MAKPKNRQPAVAAVAADPKAQLERAESLMVAGDLRRAQALCEELLRRHPKYFGAQYTLGLVHHKAERLDDALAALARAHALEPESPLVLQALARVHRDLSSFELAVSYASQAVQANPRDVGACILLGDILHKDRESEAAAEAYRTALLIDPGSAKAQLALARVLRELGEFAESEAILMRLFEAGDRSLDIVLNLSLLPSDPLGAQTAALLEEIARTTPQVTSTSVFRLFRWRVLHNCNDHAEAWRSLVETKAAIARENRVSRQRQQAVEADNLAMLDDLVAITPASDLPDKPFTLCILGTSRSGKTTVERIIGTSGLVKRGFESRTLSRAAERAFHQSALPPRGFVQLLPPALYPLFREIYFKDLAGRMTDGQRIFTSTQPARSVDAAHLPVVLPNVRYIFVKRDRADTALRILSSNYAEGNHYAYAIEDTLAHIDYYEALIDRIHALLPDRSVVLRYEDVVANPQIAIDAAERLCGLSLGIEAAGPLPNDIGCADPYRGFMGLG